MNKETVKFDFKNLLVWQKAICFAKDIILLTNTIDTERKHFRLIENLESAATSISNNIAEDKGRNSQKEFKQFLYIARGSLFEVVSQLNLFEQVDWIKKKELDKLESDAVEIGKMINSLINSIKATL